MLGGMIFVLMGLCFSVLHKQIGDGAAQFWDRVLGIHFSERGYRIGFLLIGILLVAFGLRLIISSIWFK